MASTQATATKKRKPATKTVTKKPAVSKAIPKQSTKTRTKSGAATKKKPGVKPAPETALTPAKPANVRKILEDSEPLPDVGLDFCGVTVKGRRHTFLLYYLTPGQSCFHNARQAGIKAGYTENTASVVVYSILRDPDIQKIVSANDKLGHQSLHEAAKRAIELKKHRAFYDPADFFTEEIKNTLLGPKKIVGLKPLDKMTEEQRMCIDGMDVKGQASIPVYLMPDRAKELNDIIKMDAEYSKSIADTGEEETHEIIIERITIREAERAKRPAELKYEIIEDPIEVEAEDEDNV